MFSGGMMLCDIRVLLFSLAWVADEPVFSTVEYSRFKCSF